MSEWHFDQHNDGWAWRCCNGSGVVAISAERFPSVLDAEADAARYGYSPGDSYVGTIGRRTNSAGAALLQSSDTLVIRRGSRTRWIWELRSGDGRVVKFPPMDFSTPDECKADAARHGLRG